MLHNILERACARRPSAPAVSDSLGSWTYAELHSHTGACAEWLRRRGVAPGDRVAVRAVSDRRVVALAYAASRAGAALVPLSPALRPFQLANVLADAEPALVFTDDAAALGGLGRRAVSLDSAWAELSAGAFGQPHGQPHADASSPALLIYTSGSTAMPKAVQCPHASVVFATTAIAQQLRYRPDDVVFCRLPLSFDYGLYQIFLAASATAELVLADPAADAGLLKEIRRRHATVIPLVPSLATLLIRHAARDPRPTRLRLFTNTGEELPRPTIDLLRKHFPGAGIQLMFGTTECKRISVLEVDGDRVRPGSVGRPLPGTVVRISNRAGDPVSAGTPGEILVSGPHVMAGYWRAPELTARTFVRDDATDQVWLHTGDYGHLDAGGYLYFQGRRDQIFKRNGTRTSTIEIEAAANDIPGVIEAAVLPPNANRDAVLYVVASIPAPEVIRELRSRLEPAKTPGICRTLTHLPRSANGKVDRGALASLVDGASA